MTQKEKLSVLIDAELDELNERRTLDVLRGDEELRKTWGRYHLIRAAMTGQLDVVVEKDFSERVMARVEQEQIKTVDAPLRFWPLAGGFAAAASVAGLAIVVLQTMQPPAESIAKVPETPAVVIAGNATKNAAISVSPVSSATPRATSAVSAPAADEQLNPYLLGHSEVMPTAGIGGMLPYVRVVSHTQDK